MPIFCCEVRDAFRPCQHSYCVFLLASFWLICTTLRKAPRANLHNLFSHMLALQVSHCFFLNLCPGQYQLFSLGNFLDVIFCWIFALNGAFSQGLSICTSDLLTVVQAITMHPRTPGGGGSRPGLCSTFFPFFLREFNVWCSGNGNYSIPAETRRCKVCIHSSFCRAAGWLLHHC